MSVHYTKRQLNRKHRKQFVLVKFKSLIASSNQSVWAYSGPEQAHAGIGMFAQIRKAHDGIFNGKAFLNLSGLSVDLSNLNFIITVSGSC
jgi:hypothetical protein